MITVADAEIVRFQMLEDSFAVSQRHAANSTYWLWVAMRLKKGTDAVRPSAFPPLVPTASSEVL